MRDVTVYFAFHARYAYAEKIKTGKPGLIALVCPFLNG